MHAWNLAQTIPLEDCSAVIAVGGDGTLHEVVNGLMFRTDGARVPIAFVPNGSGNDTCKSIGVTSVE
jgi:diacylglycerol kinase (ATP)